jgi:hypothetical protein
MGFKLYDFTGGEAPPKDKKERKSYDEKWASLLAYKKKWGGQEYPYYHFVKVKKKLSYKAFRVLSRPDLVYRTYKKRRFVKPKIINQEYVLS